MKRFLSILMTLLLAATPFMAIPLTANAADINVIATKHTYSNANTTIPYRLILPDNYNANGNYPMLLFLHGAGERGNDNELQFFNCVQKIYDTMPEDCIIVVPQCPLQQQWVDVLFATGTYSTDSVPESNELKAVVEIVKQLSENYAVDTDRIYAAGLSMGGYGTWDLMVRHNDIFAAAIAICGGADASKADLLKYTPLFVFHGSADPTVPVSGSQNVVNAIKNLGGTLVEYTEFAGLGHGAWNPAFETAGLLDKLLACKLSDRYPAPSTESEGTIGGTKQNVALGATATVSGLETNDGTFSPSYAVDGNGSTRVSFANDVDTQWLLLDLKQTYTVSSFEIAFKEHISEYEIQVSTDGKNFVSVYNLTGGAEQVTQTDSIILDAPVMARYVKYIQKKRWFYAPWNKYYSGGIFEFCVYTDSGSQGAQKYSNIIGTAKTFLANTSSSDARYANVLKYSEQLEAYLKMPNAQVKIADGLYEAIEKNINATAEINLAYQKSYTTTGTYTVNGAVQYPDKNGNSMTDGALAPANANWKHEAYMAFNKSSEDYKN
ncbi:MAG: discoidin domain-containing protein, partial [Clostridia bacterium]|nr:discoidin domain-containing protein [Clostridia bacterium]